MFIFPSYLTVFYKVLWGNQSPGEENVTTRKSKKTKQKAIIRFYWTFTWHFSRQIVKMFGAVTLIFAFCWLPYHVYFIISYFYPAIMKVEQNWRIENCTLTRTFDYTIYIRRLFFTKGAKNAIFNTISALDCAMSMQR